MPFRWQTPGPDWYVQPDDYDTETYIFDTDGTLATRDETDPNVRIPYDYTRVLEDWPVDDVILTMNALDDMGKRLIFVSGREVSCFDDTALWYRKMIGIKLTDGRDSMHRSYPMLMRSIGDRRPDTVLKQELFDRYIRPQGWRIAGVFEDRNRVVRMWREQLGLTVFHVADHDF